MKNNFNINKLFNFFMNKSGKETITIVVLIGVLLLVISLPTDKKTSDSTNQLKSSDNGMVNSSNKQDTDGCSSVDSTRDYEEYLEEKIASLLSKVEGVGKTQVIVNVRNSAEKIVATDNNTTEENINETDSAGGVRTSKKIQNTSENVMYDTADGSAPFVMQENMPEIEGVVVAAQGGGDGTVVAEITSAVEALLGVAAHKIKVMKMS